MPYLQKGTDTPFGLIPYDKVRRAQEYDTVATQKIWAGSPVVMTSAGTVSIFAANTDINVLGVAATTVASSSSTGKLLVYDDPEQLFAVQDDGDTTHIALTNIGNTASMIGFTGNDTTDRSIVELDSSTAAAGAYGTTALPLKIIRLHPVEGDSYASAAGSPKKWVVKFNPQVHYFASNSAV